MWKIETRLFVALAVTACQQGTVTTPAVVDDVPVVPDIPDISDVPDVPDVIRCIPTPELCDGLDNDCDPNTADGSDEETLATACDSNGDLCSEGAFVCTDGVLRYAQDPDEPPAPAICMPTEQRTLLLRVWHARRSDIATLMTPVGRAFADLDRRTYQVQGALKDLLRAAHMCADTVLLDEILETTLSAAAALDDVDETLTRSPYGPDDNDTYAALITLPQSYKMWTMNGDFGGQSFAEERPLQSSQFIHFLSYALRIISEQPTRTIMMDTFVATYASVVWHHHLHRWIFLDDGSPDPQFNTFGIFGARGASCNYGSFNHRDHVQNILLRRYGKDPALGSFLVDRSYCNQLYDSDMWIIAAAGEVLLAHHHDSSMYALSEENRSALRGYVQIGSAAIDSWMTPSELTDFAGRTLVGLNFGLGANDDITKIEDLGSLIYADYDGWDYPGSVASVDDNKTVKKDLGWDLHHASRFVDVFESLAASRLASGSTFPSWSARVQLANQLVYGAFNKDLELPLFASFMDGSNGWYRVDYDRAGTGKFPWSLSDGMLISGYAHWRKYVPDVGRVADRLWDILKRAAMVQDVSGNHHHVVIKGTGFSDTANLVPSRSGYGYQHGAGADIVVSAYKPPSQAVTLAGWIYLDRTWTTDETAHLLFGFASDGFWLGAGSEHGLMYWVTDVGWKGASVVFGNPGWHHAAMVRDSDGMASVYVDGTVTETFNYAADLTGNALRLSAHSIGTENAILDDVMVYERALTVQEITSIIEDNPHPSGLAVRWTFDDVATSSERQLLRDYYSARHIGGVGGSSENTFDPSLNSDVWLRFLGSFAIPVWR